MSESESTARREIILPKPQTGPDTFTFLKIALRDVVQIQVGDFALDGDKLDLQGYFTIADDI